MPVCTPPASSILAYVFFFKAEDGIRDLYVTGVQTCALPICEPSLSEPLWLHGGAQNRQSQQSVPNTSRKDSRAARPRDARATARTCADLVTARPQPPGTQQNLGPPPPHLRLNEGSSGERWRRPGAATASGTSRRG